ncbi:MAG: threonine synthase, partial [Anaerolineales bacterium]
IWVEPASAAGLAGLAHEIRVGNIDVKGKQIAAVCTGHGLKDPQIMMNSMPDPQVIPATMAALETILKSSL